MAITTVLVIIIVFLAIWMSENDDINMSKRTIANYESALEKGKYSSIPVKTVCGEGGWLCIVDEDGNNLYSSNGSATSYTRGELGCIQTFGTSYQLTEQTITLPDDEINHMIFYTEKFGDFTAKEYILLDKDLNVLTSSKRFEKTQFTESELYFLMYNFNDSNEELWKFPFTREDGKLRYAICYDTNDSFTATPYIFAGFVVVGVICLLIAVLILYIRYINKHVQRPLKALGNAMSEFAQNGYRDKLNYIGSKEFEQLVDSFNQMVSLLNASEEQRQVLEQDRQRMLAGLSHDLKTPITIIQGFSKAIRDGLVSEEDKQKYLNLIITKSENMGTLINEFYEYSKLDHPDFKLAVKNTDVAELVRTYLAGRYDEFEIAGYNLDADITEEKLICAVDAPQLSRVFANLTDNFFKYTPQGSTLHIGLSRDGDSVRIVFADNGGGITPGADDIFAPFVVGERSRSKQGTGLGLAVCQKIITAHGGKISLSSTPADGYTTEFDITLPLSAV